MRRFAVLAVVLFASRVILCGLAGFGLGAAFQERPAAASGMPAGMAPCHSGAAGPVRSSEQQRECRAHCAALAHAVSSVAPWVAAPQGILAALPPGASVAPTTARLALPQVGRAPPKVRLPILKRSLLL